MESSLSPLLSLSLPPSLWGVVVRRGLIQLLLVLYKRHGAETPHHVREKTHQACSHAHIQIPLTKCPIPSPLVFLHYPRVVLCSIVFTASQPSSQRPSPLPSSQQASSQPSSQQSSSPSPSAQQTGPPQPSPCYGQPRAWPCGSPR